MTHAEIVKRVREQGIEQCRGTLIIRDKSKVVGCCELGLLMHALDEKWITYDEQAEMIRTIENKTNKMVTTLNDVDELTWDDFTKIVDEPQETQA